MTTLDPGASDVFTQGLDLSPFATAFFAKIPAAIITDGFEVLVHEVIDAMVTAPLSIAKSLPFTCVGTDAEVV